MDRSTMFCSVRLHQVDVSAVCSVSRPGQPRVLQKLDDLYPIVMVPASDFGYETDL